MVCIFGSMGWVGNIKGHDDDCCLVDSSIESLIFMVGCKEYANVGNYCFAHSI